MVSPLDYHALILPQGHLLLSFVLFSLSFFIIRFCSLCFALVVSFFFSLRSFLLLVFLFSVFCSSSVTYVSFLFLSFSRFSHFSILGFNFSFYFTSFLFSSASADSPSLSYVNFLFGHYYLLLLLLSLPSHAFCVSLLSFLISVYIPFHSFTSSFPPLPCLVSPSYSSLSFPRSLLFLVVFLPLIPSFS